MVLLLSQSECAVLFDRHVLDLVKPDQLAEQAAENSLLFEVEACETDSIIFSRDRRQFWKTPRALSREREQLHAAIIQRRRARDPSLRLEFVHYLRHRTPREAQGLCELPRSNLWTRLDVTHHNPFGDGSMPGLQRPRESARNVVGDTPEPVAKVRFQIWSRVLLAASRICFHRNYYTFQGNDTQLFSAYSQSGRRDAAHWRLLQSCPMPHVDLPNEQSRSPVLDEF